MTRNLPILRDETFSTLPRVMHCVGSAALPQDFIEETDLSTAGNAKHQYLCDVPEMGPDAALALVPVEHRDMCEAIDLERLPLHRGGVRELAVGLNLATGETRIIGSEINRDYGEPIPGEIAGTIDRAWLDESGVLHVRDYKGAGKQAPAKRHWQLIAGGIVLAKEWGASEAALGTLRILPDGGVIPDTARVDLLDLLDAEERLRERMLVDLPAAREDVANGRNPPTVQGPWCNYCPAYNHCPSKRALARMLVTQPQDLEPMLFSALTPDQQREAILLIERADEFLKRAKKEVKAWHAFHETDMGDGNVYGQYEKPNTKVDGSVAFEVIKALHGLEVAIAAVSMDSTVTSIKRALSEAGIKPVAPAARAIIDEIEKRGGVDRTPKKTIGVHQRAA